MADEARIRSSLQINITANNFQYRSTPTEFTEDVSTANGPTPGVVSVPVTGVNIDLSKLAYPGLCQIQSLESEADSPNNYVMLGIYDGTSFYPMLEIRPGQGYVFRLYRYLRAEFVGTGTNTDTNTLRAMSALRTCNIRVEAFEN